MAVVITNQVMSDPSGGAMFVSDPKKAVGEAFAQPYYRRHIYQMLTDSCAA